MANLLNLKLTMSFSVCISNGGKILYVVVNQRFY
jgi:hypothetical protein